MVAVLVFQMPWEEGRLNHLGKGHGRTRQVPWVQDTAVAGEEAAHIQVLEEAAGRTLGPTEVVAPFDRGRVFRYCTN